MKKFKDLSVSKKLLTAFTGLTAMLMIVGTVFLFGIFHIIKMDTYLYEVQTAPIDDLIHSIESLYQFRIDSRGMVIFAGNPQRIDEFEKSYIDAKEVFLDRAQIYRASITNEQSFQLLDEGVRLFTDKFDPAIQKCLQAAKAGNQEAALNALSRETVDIQKIYDNFDALVDNRMSAAENTIESNASTARVLSVLLIVTVIAGGVCFIFFGSRIAKMISKPIMKVVNAANNIALGRVEVDLQDIDSKDEIGQLAEAFSRMLDGIQKQVYAAKVISDGDFTQAVPLRSEEDALGIALQKIEDELSQTLHIIDLTADQVNTGSGQVASASQELASGTTEQAATIEQLNASVASVARQAEENADSVREAAEYVKLAGNGVSLSNEYMQKLTLAMEEIGESSQQISKITKLVEDIAFQTNILSLNAAVEAARAGNAGKGFAVVADEVRNLAVKSAEAAKQTSALIEKSVSNVSEGEQLAVETQKCLVDVSEKTALVVKSVQKIEHGSIEQVGAIEQINQGLTQVSSVVQTNAATAEESSASSEELAAQAQALAEAVSKFKLAETMEYTHEIKSEHGPVAMDRREKHVLQQKNSGVEGGFSLIGAGSHGKY